MRDAAKSLEFELAALLRDEIRELKKTQVEAEKLSSVSAKGGYASGGKPRRGR